MPWRSASLSFGSIFRDRGEHQSTDWGFHVWIVFGFLSLIFLELRNVQCGKHRCAGGYVWKCIVNVDRVCVIRFMQLVFSNCWNFMLRNMVGVRI
jgi:hypothetical protein